MKHLPGFVEQAKALKTKGIDEIACLSVNDAFVMGAWGDSQQARGKVRMLADGNADFTKALGLTLDASGFGMGVRSQRYAMVVKRRQGGTVAGRGGAGIECLERRVGLGEAVASPRPGSGVRSRATPAPPKNRKRRWRRAVATLAVLVPVVSVVVYSSFQVSDYECTVCMEFAGRRECRTVAGKTEEEALRGRWTIAVAS